MHNRPPIVALIAFLLASGSAWAQQAVPDAPQPQKKAAPRQQPAPATDPPPKDDNAFPEAASQAAADAAAQEKAAPAQDGSGARHSTADDNPFPEAVSKAAAKAAGNEPAPQPAAKPDLPPGVSSSQSTSAENEAAASEVPQDPARAKNDTEVGSFYLKTGNLPGALIRFQEASTADPTNIDAIFGVAEAQRMLGKKADAVRAYQMYLDIVPHGPKAKEAIKALKALQSAK